MLSHVEMGVIVLLSKQQRIGCRVLDHIAQKVSTDGKANSIKINTIVDKDHESDAREDHQRRASVPFAGSRSKRLQPTNTTRAMRSSNTRALQSWYTIPPC